MTQAIFNNIEGIISSHINQAEERINIAVAWFTNNALYEMLTKACEKCVRVKVLLLNDIVNRNEFGLDFGIITKLGAEVRLAKTDLGIMHNKFCIIDNLVVTGSYNWTYHANKNRENILLTDEESVVNNYIKEFDRLFGDAIPIPQPYEHLKWTDIKEGDFSELRRNIYRDVIAKNDENHELKRIKLIKLNQAYKSGNAEELAYVSSLPIEQHLRTIADVLTSQSQNYAFKLWEENIIEKPMDNVYSYESIVKWYYTPDALEEDQYHRECIKGKLRPYECRDHPSKKGLKLNIYDEQFIKAVKMVLNSKPLSSTTRKCIPDSMLLIDKAQMFFYKFPSPMFNKSQPKTRKNTTPRTISAINLLGIVREDDGENVVFYDGWDPQKRGEKIMKEFFVKGL